MGVIKEIRDAIGKKPGDKVSVVMEVDAEPRVVGVPDGLKRALEKDDAARAAFEKLSYTHKKEYAIWINEAKKPETKEKRIVKTLEMLTEKKKA